MHIHTYIPVQRLQPFIRNFLVVESEQGTDNSVLPDTAAVMAFRFKGQVSSNSAGNSGILPAACISGIRKTVRVMQYAANTGTLIITFRGAGAAAFFKAPLHEIFEQSMPLDALTGTRQLDSITERLCAAANHTARFRIAEQWLLSILQTRMPDTRIQAAVQHLATAAAPLKIKDLCYQLNISQDALEKRFRSQVGTTPKQYAGIVRLRKFIARYTPEQTLTAQAYDAGYFDQAHFIKDFKAFTGQAPQDFFRSPAFW
ncbi:MAG TPA: helix-turn-helix transcriptional regulator [Chitinophaga sp.]|uniref:helix-turn-helix transcriptional regulator n=1 Tax=Chitinophaga sp. TaxID=1869181 RepID=UPI002DC0074D|nr:helix-turn-helix transcriptional regulator [Chitinophaga sp.]HEU4552164.1 helix-turn-helix transcriptional regulator [Chitinophaga sp.]